MQGSCIQPMHLLAAKRMSTVLSLCVELVFPEVLVDQDTKPQRPKQYLLQLTSVSTWLLP